MPPAAVQRTELAGWGIVAVSAIAMSTGPGQFAFGSLGLFILPLEREFGWTRADISLASTFFTIALALTIPFIGQLTDRYGSRAILIPSVCVCGMLLGLTGALLQHLWSLYLLFALIGCLGAGANALPYLRTISTWFDRRRGLAIGIAMGGSGFGYAYVPPLIQHLNETAGWRSGYYVLAGITLLLALPLVVLFLRDAAPGAGHGTREEGQETQPEAGLYTGYTTAALLQTGLLWQLFAIFCLLSFSLYGLLLHLVPMLVDRGMPEQDAARVAATLGLSIVGTRIIIGYFIDRFFAPHVALFCFLLTAGGLLLLAGGVAHALAFLAALCIGFSFGAEIDLLAYLTGRYFGVQNFGRVYGILFTSFLIGTSLGPWCYGLVYDATGSYVAILSLCVGLIAAAALLTWRLPRYGTRAN